MFQKGKAKIQNVEKTEKVKPVGVFGENGYQMKDSYNADELVIANFSRISSTKNGLKVETTRLKYIFAMVIENGVTKYQELFSGFLASDKEKSFDLPFVTNIVPYTKDYPKARGTQISKMAFLWILNDINLPKQTAHQKYDTLELKQKR